MENLTSPWPHYMRALPTSWKTVHVILLLSYLILGLWMKMVIFRYLKDHGRGRAINSLIGMDQRVSMVGVVTILAEIVVLSISVPLQDVTGEKFCLFMTFCAIFGFGCMTFGGCGIALYRVLFMTAQGFVRARIGEKFLTRIIVVIGLALSACSAICVTLFKPNNQSFFQDLCLGYEPTHFQTPHDDGSWMLTAQKIHRFVLGMGVLANLAEITCYTYVFTVVFQQDQKMAILLPWQAPHLKIRRRTHAVSMFGQFLAWSSETAVLGLLSLPLFFSDSYSSKNWVRNLVLHKPGLDFFLPTLIQVLSSSDLRPRLFGNPFI